MAITRKEIGALWCKFDKDGKEFLRGSIDRGLLGGCNIIVYKNDKPKGDQPNWTIHIPKENKDS